MKRFFLLIVLMMVASWIVASHRSPFRRPARPPAHWPVDRRVHEDDEARRLATDTHKKTRRALSEARQALAEARDEVRQALDEARYEVHNALDEVRVAFVSDDDSRRPLPPVPPVPPLPPVPPAGASASEDADDIPVPIVPGTRVTRAEAKTPAERNAAPTVAAAGSTPSPHRTVTGRRSATKERAVADARSQLQAEIATWLDPEVPGSWTLPARMLDAMVLKEPEIKTITKDYGEIFEATLTVDTSPQRRTALVELYTREAVERRLVSLGAVLAFVLICLAAISGYIRADEATRGYYTNRLRMLAAAGVGASGVIIYHMVA
jgi:hypothetical protein